MSPVTRADEGRTEGSVYWPSARAQAIALPPDNISGDNTNVLSRVDALLSAAAESARRLQLGPHVALLQMSCEDVLS